MVNVNFEKLSKNKLVKEGTIYPITNINLSHTFATSLENNKKDYKNIDNFSIAPGIEIFKICSEKKYKEILNIIKEIFEYIIKRNNLSNFKGMIGIMQLRRKYPNNKKNKIIHIDSGSKIGIKNLINFLPLSQYNKDLMLNFIKSISNIYLKEKVFDDIEKLSQVSILRYNSDNFNLPIHIDVFDEFKGPVFVFNFGDSFIDYIPNKIIYDYDNKYRPFRIKLKPGILYKMDGDSRFLYRHGVPKKAIVKNKIRYALVIRFPVIYKDKTKCKLTEKFIDELFKKELSYRIKKLNLNLSEEEVLKNKDKYRDILFPCYSDTYY